MNETTEAARYYRATDAGCELMCRQDDEDLRTGAYAWTRDASQADRWFALMALTDAVAHRTGDLSAKGILELYSTDEVVPENCTRMDAVCGELVAWGLVEVVPAPDDPAPPDDLAPPVPDETISF